MSNLVIEDEKNVRQVKGVIFHQKNIDFEKRRLK